MYGTPMGMCQRSGKLYPLDGLVKDGLFPNLLVCPEWYEPPLPVHKLPPAETFANPSPAHYQITIEARLPAYDFDIHDYQTVPRCTSFVGDVVCSFGGIVITNGFLFENGDFIALEDSSGLLILE